MHSLARNFAQQVKVNDFGEVFEFKKVFVGKTSTDEYVTVEEYIDGDFIKYINNDGSLCSKQHPLMEKAECFAHYTFQKSKGKLIVLDLQGFNNTLYDPEISSSELLNDDGTIKFCNGNLASEAISTFFKEHVCGSYCKMLNLNLRV